LDIRKGEGVCLSGQRRDGPGRWDPGGGGRGNDVPEAASLGRSAGVAGAEGAGRGGEGGAGDGHGWAGGLEDGCAEHVGGWWWWFFVSGEEGGFGPSPIRVVFVYFWVWRSNWTGLVV
jgi:hypothetical protein